MMPDGDYGCGSGVAYCNWAEEERGKLKSISNLLVTSEKHHKVFGLKRWYRALGSSSLSSANVVDGVV